MSFICRARRRISYVDMVNEGIDVLGRHVQNGEISIAKAKVDAFLALGSPSSFQELGKDLGMFTWLTDHLPFAVSISAPLPNTSIPSLTISMKKCVFLRDK